jgi:hypothetical protein
VDALHRLAVLAIRETGALDRDAAAQLVDDLVDSRRGGGRLRRRRGVDGLDQLPRRVLGFSPREPVAFASRPDLADAAIAPWDRPAPSRSDPVLWRATRRCRARVGAAELR